jgi:hypothetical protein
LKATDRAIRLVKTVTISGSAPRLGQDATDA